MKIRLACVLGLAVLVTSFTCGGSLVRADALEAASSALQTLAPDADAYGAESELHCVYYSDGADNCIVNPQPAAGDQASSAVSEIEPSATDAAPAGQSADAIVVAVVQSVSIAVPGQNPWYGEAVTQTGSISEPTAPSLILEAKTTALDREQ
jgi:hypothetical protein